MAIDLAGSAFRQMLDSFTTAANNAMVKGISNQTKRTGPSVPGDFIPLRSAGFILLLFLIGWLHPLATFGRDEKNENGKAWYDARLRAFFSAKETQARALAATEKKPVAPDVWLYFKAGIKGDWKTTTNLWNVLNKRARPDDGSAPDESINKVWSPVLETCLAWEQFFGWKEKYVLAYGNDIIKSIPPGSIYFGGTDPGRGVITVMSKSQIKGDPFYTITQNALADGRYLDYVRSMYGGKIQVPTDADASICFSNYSSDAQARFYHDEHYPNEPKQVRPGEEIHTDPGKGTISVSGNTAVMAINGLIAKLIFDRNSTREFYVEESFPLDWMSPYLSPNGLIMKLNRQPLAELTDDMIKHDRAFWSHYLKPILGDWLKDDTSVAEIAGFAEKVYLKRDFHDFKGDPEFIGDSMAQKAFGKLRASIAASIYDWRYRNAKSPAKRERMLKESDFAYRQAIAICPYSPEAVFHYVRLLADTGRFDDALVVSESSLKLDPGNDAMATLVKQLRDFKKLSAVNPMQQLQPLEKKFQDEPTNTQAALSLISTYLQLNQPGKADMIVESLEKAVHEHPDNSQMSCDLMRAYMGTRKRDKAAALADKLLADPKLDTNGIYTLASYFAQESDYARLDKTLELLTNRLPDSPEAWYDLAGVELLSGKKDRAPQNLKRALEENARRLSKDPGAIDISDKVRKDSRFTELLKLPEIQGLLQQK